MKGGTRFDVDGQVDPVFSADSEATRWWGAALLYVGLGSSLGLGSLVHCSAMCGPWFMERTTSIKDSVLYGAGRGGSYLLAGALAGALGQSIAPRGVLSGSLGTVASLIFGSVLIVLGLRALLSRQRPDGAVQDKSAAPQTILVPLQKKVAANGQSPDSQRPDGQRTDSQSPELKAPKSWKKSALLSGAVTALFPCFVLGSTLAVAASTRSVGSGAALLLGVSLPFSLATIGGRWALKHLQITAGGAWLTQHRQKVQYFSQFALAACLVVSGVFWLKPVFLPEAPVCHQPEAVSR